MGSITVSGSAEGSDSGSGSGLRTVGVRSCTGLGDASDKRINMACEMRECEALYLVRSGAKAAVERCNNGLSERALVVGIDRSADPSVGESVDSAVAIASHDG